MSSSRIPLIDERNTTIDVVNYMSKVVKIKFGIVCHYIDDNSSEIDIVNDIVKRVNASRLLKTKLPYIDENNDTIDTINYIVMVLNRS